VDRCVASNCTAGDADSLQAPPKSKGKEQEHYIKMSEIKQEPRRRDSIVREFGMKHPAQSMHLSCGGGEDTYLSMNDHTESPCYES
jgi:hypothetical protein